MVGGFIGARHRLALCQGAGTFKSQRSRIRALTADPRQLRVLQRSAVQERDTRVGGQGGVPGRRPIARPGFEVRVGVADQIRAA